jgi:hypothetical protein
MWLELWTPLDPGVMDTCSCPQSSFFNLIHFCHYSYLLLWPVLFPIGIIFMGKVSFYWKKFQVLLLNPKTSPQMKSELKNLICKTFNKLASLFFLLTMPSRTFCFLLPILKYPSLYTLLIKTCEFFRFHLKIYILPEAILNEPWK